MLYSHPGQHNIHDDSFDYIVVAEDQVDEAIKKGWSLTTTEAKEKYSTPPKAKAAKKPKTKPKAKE